MLASIDTALLAYERLLRVHPPNEKVIETFQVHLGLLGNSVHEWLGSDNELARKRGAQELACLHRGKVECVNEPSPGDRFRGAVVALLV